MSGVNDETGAVGRRPVLLVDALNVFVRHFSANPTLNANGEHVGGAVGFVRAVASLVRRFSPVDVVVVWEGRGSLRRRRLYPEYKAHRRPVGLNRWNAAIPQTVDNHNWQLELAVGMLSHTPVAQLYVPHCEADDVIAYLVTTRFKGEPVVVVSSDKDLWQLLTDDAVTIFRPGRRTIVRAADVVTEMAGVTPTNWALAKAVVGDPGDNIVGVHGVGFKKLTKRFPRFTRDEPYGIDELFEDARVSTAAHTNVRLYRDVLEAEERIRLNYRLVVLDGSMMSAELMRQVDDGVDAERPKLSKLDVYRTANEAALVNFDVEGFVMSFSQLNAAVGVRR